MKRTVALILLLLVTLSAGWPAHGAQGAPRTFAITVTDDHHTKLTLAATPSRLIALGNNITEILFALGLGKEVVGVSSFSNYPRAASGLPVVYSYTGPSIEKIVALKPDLVITAAIVPSSVVSKLRNLHLKVLVTDPHSLNDILADIRLLAAASGVPGAGSTLAGKLRHRIDAVTAEVRHVSTHPVVFYELDKTLYTVGHGSFMDAMITLAGGVNVARGVTNSYPQLSAERVLAANPQYIILGDAAYGITAAQVAARPGWSAIAAVKLHHIVPFNDDLASRAGPRIVDGLEALAHILHPEVVH